MIDGKTAWTNGEMRTTLANMIGGKHKDVRAFVVSIVLPDGSCVVLSDRYDSEQIVNILSGTIASLMETDA